MLLEWTKGKGAHMIIDLHVHSKSSDGLLSIQNILKEAKARNIGFLSITDHDSIESQADAIAKSKASKLRYLTGVELNVSFSHPKFQKGKVISLDFLGYQYDPNNETLIDRLQIMANYRTQRAARILDNLNTEFQKENIAILTEEDLKQIEKSADGPIGRPHIAEYLIKKGIVKSRQEAFDRYLVKCDVPKFPLYLKEASKLVRDAGGKLILAHPNDPHGTSLASLTKVLAEQTEIIEEKMVSFIDGIECWHSRNTAETTEHYVTFAEEHKFIMSGGSDCHQKPIVMGTVKIPEWVINQFK